jgi:hypothetical protein
VIAHREAVLDFLLYAGSILAALTVAVAAGIPLQREWGRMAAPAYAAGAVVAGWLSLRRAGRDGRALRWLALAVLIGAALLPLAVEAVWRARTAQGLHAQAEAIVTEEAAGALRRGENPYGAEYLHGPLEDRPLGTKTHFPYLPAMLLFGLPRAFDGPSPLADARVAFAAFTLAVAALAFSRPLLQSVSPRQRRIGFLVLAVLPTGALLMATGGDDLPVLALMFLALALVGQGRPGTGGVVAGLAAITKQTAWILLPFLVLTALDREGRPGRIRFSLAAVVVLGAGLIPFVAWSPGEFVEDVIRFPLGLGEQQTPAQTPTLGRALITLLPSWRVPLTVILVCLVLAVFLLVLVKWPPATPAMAARNAGIVFVAAILLAPSARFGYVVYPINLFVWAWILHAARDPAPREGAQPVSTSTP